MSVVPTLPQLAPDELDALYNGDPDGARRYKILRAVLVRGLTQREAAAEAGVSERTVRNVLRAYMRSGSLEALRTRAPASRRWSAHTAAGEEALATAMAEDPLAGGDRLWRRAQELMGEAGARLSRRTAYRLLAQLRARGRSDASADLVGAVRSALPLLHEEPPLTLGGSALARRLLPNERDVALRGTVLRQALRSAIERLRPAGQPDVIDRSWWPYLICYGEYEEERSRAELQHELALSASSYSRAKRQGLNRVAAALPQIVAQLTALPATQACERLPRTPDFVGRHDEQAYYAWRLQAEGHAHIWGLPGSGKTALAAELAAESHRSGLRVLWHTCLAGREASLAGIVRGLIEALSSAPDDELIQQARQLGADPLQVLPLLDQLGERLAARPTLIVLDDFHRVGAEEVLPLLQLLDELVSRRRARALFVSRVRPAGGDWPALPGLREEEAQLLWDGAPPLPAEQWRALYAAVCGLPQPIRLAAAAHRRAGAMARGDEWMAVVDAWADEAVWSRLEPVERRVLAAAQELETRAPLGTLRALCQALGIDADVVDRLTRLGLLPLTTGERPLPALQGRARLILADDEELRAALDELAGEEAAQRQAGRCDEVLGPVEVQTVPANSLELLARVRYALKRSVTYLRSHCRDREASRLAQELVQLQSVLPDPGRLRLSPAPVTSGGGQRARLRRGT